MNYLAMFIEKVLNRIIYRGQLKEDNLHVEFFTNAILLSARFIQF